MKQQRIARPSSQKAPEIIDQRQPKLPDLQASSDVPLRTVFMMEVGDMEAARVQLLVQQISEVYAESKGGIHYVIPVRKGKIGSDIFFEEEFRKVVEQTCEVKDGKIVLKDGAKECKIVRESI